MKTKNNVQKTAFTASLILSGLFLAGLVSASASTSIRNNSNIKAISNEVVADKALEVENWMLSENYFSTGNLFRTATDNVLTIEAWMINELYFGAIADESPMTVENWMTDATLFMSSTLPEPAEEELMQIENWMNDESLFVPGLPENATESGMIAESWMMENGNWK